MVQIPNADNSGTVDRNDLLAVFRAGHEPIVQRIMDIVPALVAETILDLAKASRTNADRGRALGTSATNEDALELIDINRSNITDDSILDLANNNRGTADRGKALGTHPNNQNNLVLLDIPAATPNASHTQRGRVELATNAETILGIRSDLATTPASVKAAIEDAPDESFDVSAAVFSTDVTLTGNNRWSDEQTASGFDTAKVIWFMWEVENTNEIVPIPVLGRIWQLMSDVGSSTVGTTTDTYVTGESRSNYKFFIGRGSTVNTFRVAASSTAGEPRPLRIYLS